MIQKSKKEDKIIMNNDLQDKFIISEDTINNKITLKLKDDYYFDIILSKGGKMIIPSASLLSFNYDDNTISIKKDHVTVLIVLLDDDETLNINHKPKTLIITSTKK